MKKAFKIIGFLIGGLFILLLGAIIIIPLVIDVDKFRPQILEAAKPYINGKVELGKLSLSLWGKVKIQAQGFSLHDNQNNKIVSVEDVYFYMPFSSILSGSPELLFHMNQPQVIVIKDRKGKLNVLSVVKTGPAAAPTAPTPGQPAPSKPSGKSDLPGIVKSARLGIEMEKAYLAYKDLAQGLTSETKDLNFYMRNISMSRPLKLEITADLDTRMAKVFEVKGPFRASLTAKPYFQGSEFQKAEVSMHASASDLDIQAGVQFHKTKGIPAELVGEMVVGPESAQVSKLNFRFHNAVIDVSAQAQGFSTQMTYNGKLWTNKIDLKDWVVLVPMLKSFELAGIAHANAEFSQNAKGVIGYQARAEVQSLKAKSPGLKAQPVFDLKAAVSTNQVDNLTFSMKAPANDLRISAKVVNFQKPAITAQVQSSGMDLDQLIDFPKPDPNTKPAATPAAGGGARGGPAADMDASLDSLRKNTALASMTAHLQIDIPKLKVMNIVMTPIQSTMSFKDLAFAIERFRMGIFNGTIASTFSVQMKPKTPTYRFSMNVENLDMKTAMASQLHLFKDTLYGRANFKMEGGGSSFNPEPAKKNLNAKGHLNIKDAVFATIDVGKMAAEALNKTMADLGNKYPPLKNQRVANPQSVDSKYESVTGDFQIAQGIFSAPNFYAKSYPGKGLDLSGNTQVNFVQNTIQAHWEVIDTHNVTKARDLSVEQAGIRVEHILADGNSPVRFPMDVSGNLFAPKISYTSVPESLGKVAINNISRAVEGKAKAELKRRAEEEAKKHLQNVIPQGGLNDLGKKLGF